MNPLLLKQEQNNELRNTDMQFEKKSQSSFCTESPTNWGIWILRETENFLFEEQRDHICILVYEIILVKLSEGNRLVSTAVHSLK